jgi:hypothetical protein
MLDIIRLSRDGGEFPVRNQPSMSGRNCSLTPIRPRPVDSPASTRHWSPEQSLGAVFPVRDDKAQPFARKILGCAFPNGLYDLLFIEMPLKSSIISRWGYLLDATERKM